MNSIDSVASTASTDTASASSASGTRRVLRACCAMSLGAVLLYFAGFSSMPVLHNAAHDTRHTAAFPCH